jgi:tetratricopeptide (TPR) repeat protein
MFKHLSTLTFIVIAAAISALGTFAHASHASPNQASHGALQARLNSLDPRSIPQHLAFYELYPETSEGKKALMRAWSLLTGQPLKGQDIPFQIHLSPTNTLAMVEYFVKQRLEPGGLLADEDLKFIEQISGRLRNRTLKGHQVWKEAEVLALSSEDVDVARGLLLSLFGENEAALQKIRSYEAVLDMMALQILTHTSLDDAPEQKIRAINWFLFEETHLRFPPHSLYAKDIDLYTFLPSVLDSRRGVCLGVSSLYLCLAQRIGLQLEVITPPGHIYVRYRDNNRIINIETTARGIHIPSQRYLSVHTRSLEQRNQKEVIGMTFFNQASLLWQNGEYKKAIAAYEKALAYLPDDPLVKELLGYNYILNGQVAKGKALLEEICDVIPDHAVSHDPLAKDFLAGKIDAKGLEVVFMHVDEKRESILKKQKQLQQALQKHPLFRTGWFHLAITWLQLGREREAMLALQRFHDLDPNDPIVEYYLAAIAWGRRDFNKSWDHLHQAEELLAVVNYVPEPLKDLRRSLRAQAPE